MEHASFNWSESPAPIEDPQLPSPESRSRELYQKLRPYLPVLLLLLVLAGLYLSRGVPKPAQAPADANDVVEAVMPLMPLRKGQIIDFGTFEKVALRSKSLSSSQRIRVVRSEHLGGIKIPLRAKKMLAPHQIVLWTDLEAAPIASGVDHPQIHFAN